MALSELDERCVSGTESELLRYFVAMAITRNQRAGIDDRWHRRVKAEDGTMRTERSALYGKVTRWRVRWVDEGGKEHSKSFERKPDAQAYLNQQTADVVRGEYVDPVKGKDTFGVVAEELMALKAHRKPKTIEGYRSLLNTVIYPRWRDVPVKSVDYQALSKWISELSSTGGRGGEGLSRSRIKQAHHLTGMVLKYAQKTGRVAKNVAQGVDLRNDLPQSDERPRHYLTHVQLQGLAARMGRFEALTLVLGYCGLRFSEAAALYRVNVDDDAKEFNIRVSLSARVETTTKTGKSRVVPVPSFVWEQLDIPADGAALMFPGSKPGHLRYGEYRWVFNRAVGEMQAAATEARAKEVADTGKAVTPEFPPITPHDLRHTAVSLYIATNRGNIKVIQRIAGHASATMTLDTYGHLMADDLAESASALDKAIRETAVSLRSKSDTRKSEAS